MNNELVKRSEAGTSQLIGFGSLQEAKSWAEERIDSGLLPDSISEPEQVLTIAQQGIELGLQPLTALNNIHIIAGRTVISSAMMGALLKRAGVEFVWDEDFVTIKNPEGKEDKRTTIHMYWFSDILKREMDAKFSVTMLQMTVAGYTKKDNWKKYPKEMLRARCLAYAVRALKPEVLMGMYTDMEMVDAKDINVEVTQTEEGDVTIA